MDDEVAIFLETQVEQHKRRFQTETTSRSHSNQNLSFLQVFDYEDTKLSAFSVALSGFLYQTNIRCAFGKAKWVAVR